MRPPSLHVSPVDGPTSPSSQAAPEGDGSDRAGHAGSARDGLALPWADPVVAEALAFAKARHAGQFRKDGRTPYVVHPVRVARSLRERGVDESDLLCAALLHDVVEDTVRPGEDDVGLLWEVDGRFGPRVARLVDELTKSPKGQESRRDYDWSFRAKSPAACLVKLADRLDNLRDWGGMEASFRKPYLAETLDLVAAVQGNPQVPGSPYASPIAAFAGDLRVVCAEGGVTTGRRPRPTPR